MNRVRLWILGAALGSFAAGMSTGLLIPKVFAGEDGVPAVDAEYVRDIVAKYGLTASQERSLRLVLSSWRQEEFRVLTSAEAAQLPPQIQNRLLAARSRLEQRTRALLDEQQRARYDLESRATDFR